MSSSKEEVESLLGREVDVVKVNDGYVVEYFNFNTSPPPVGITPLEACSLFVDWYKETQRGIEDNVTAEHS